MKLIRVTHEKVDEFIAYCKKHRKEVDESFLMDKDLVKFEPNEENPTYIVTDINGEVIAAASLMIDDYSKRGRKARFRIFHSDVESKEIYQLVFQEIVKHTNGIDKLFLFIPVENTTLANFIEGLRFSVQRYSFLLVRENMDTPEYVIPEGYEIREFREGYDEEVWCTIRNVSFATVKGSETPITPEMVTKMMKGNDQIKGGALVLYHKDKPVGVIRGSKDEFEGALIVNIGPIAIIPEYQRKGLGRILLRAIHQLAMEKGYNQTILCVNADNEQAKSLYLQEGYKQVEAVACYEHDINKAG